MSDNPRIKGVEYDHSSCRFRLDSVVETRVKEITYGAAREGSQFIYGTSRQPISRTRGKYTPKDVGLTLYRAAWDEFRGRLGPGYMEKEFTIIVERSEAGAAFVKDTIVGCKIKDAENSSSEGGEPATTKLTMECMYVLEGDVDPMLQFNR